MHWFYNNAYFFIFFFASYLEVVLKLKKNIFVITGIFTKHQFSVEIDFIFYYDSQRKYYSR